MEGGGETLGGETEVGLACRETGERGEEADLTASLDISCKIVEADGKESGVSGEWGRWWRGRRGE